MRRLFLFAPLLLLYCTLVTLAVTEQHRCMFHKVSTELGTTYDVSKHETLRTLNSTSTAGTLQTTRTNPPNREELPSGWESIRIKLVSDRLKKGEHHCSGKGDSKTIKTVLKKDFTCTDHDALTPEKEEILVKKILPEAIKLHEERLFVKRLSGPIIVPQFSNKNGLCFKFIPEEQKTRNFSGADMVLFAAAEPTPEGTFAWAATCATLGRNGRPVVGIINYGPRYIVATPQRVRVAAHEIAHALGFNFELMKMDRLVGKADSLRDKEDVFVVSTENTRREAMEHYKCNSAEGMELQGVTIVQVGQRAKAAAILAQVASVQEEYELGESHSNVMDDPLTGEESVGSVVQERRGEEGSSAAKFTENVHHSSNVWLKSRSLYGQTAMMASEPSSECTPGEDGEVAGGKQCIVEAPVFISNHKGKMTRSHWSRRIAKDELMVDLVGAGYYTAITMGAFADLGYYKVNWTMAEQMSWGNNSGCGLLEDKCVEGGSTKFPDMFCTTKSGDIPESLQCTSDRQSMGRCSSIGANPVKNDLPVGFRYFSDSKTVGSEESEEMDYCPFVKALPQKSCISVEKSNNMPGSKIGMNSRCVEGKELKTKDDAAVGAVCVEVSCKFNKVIVRYSGNDKWYSCPEGTNLTVNGSVLQGKIVCPKYADVCNTINKTLDESQGPATDPDPVKAIQTSQPEVTEATGTARPSESDGNQEVTAPVVQNEASTATESNRSETKEESNTSSVSGQNNNIVAGKGIDGSFKASVFASVMFVFLTLSVIMAP
ncbi:surface protease GP63 [Trypanosoma theileri]|uniref:Leishmanolysin-like peptidase n=1 Tax=Trypanosoma theileri TaxID=67003 RepID=A0A1X0NKX6_9TRYP|nr:surface protease GP63 [Trypanosoma theileri]ORC85346.1 surface protease GP63 [Trypanosoma theileri]